MELIKYRDIGMATHTYFWKNKDNQTVSPFFDSQKEAEDWIVNIQLDNIRAGAEQQGDDDKGYELSTQEKHDDFVKKRNYDWDEWKANKDIV